MTGAGARARRGRRGASEIRAASPDELTGVRDTARAALALDAADVPLLVSRLAAPPEGRQWAALVTPGLEGVAFVSTSWRTEGVGCVDLLAVDPHAQGQGIGRALVTAAEEWLRERGVREARLAGNPPCYAWPGIDVRYTAAACLAESLGYERYRTAFNMTVDLTGYLPSGAEPVWDIAGGTGVTGGVEVGFGFAAGVPPTGEGPEVPAGAVSYEQELASLASAGVAVRTALPDEREAVVEFAREHWNDNWAWEVSQATGCHYAVRGGEILGFASWGSRPCWFGPMGTAEAARGLGVGRVLLRRCLQEQAATGQRSTQIGWVDPWRFYARTVGARVERVFWLYRRSLA
ncbi:GNAT family N-acetyltransferase [Sphaerisporangium fuscum]|uniref:GNAT family N-acetyltransferase n=1 Tax=Sphaerisporangium fuscum TaxID=2835868 RepID=UPI0027E2AC8D|nr:GNAT family N-acetyltransferase [Sphaerisporangium fuscum]